MELLAVIAIIALMATLLNGLRSENPKGLSGATSRVQSMLSLTRQQAMLGNIDDPDASPEQAEKTKYMTKRARLIILKDKDDPVRHLRACGIIVGAQKVPSNSTGKEEHSLGSDAEITWFATSDVMMLPEGFFYARNNLPGLRPILTSDAQNQTFDAPTMRIDFPKRRGQVGGSGTKEWYYYEFLNDGTCNTQDQNNVTGARLMFIQGDLAPNAEDPKPKDSKIVGGVIITPRGLILPITGQNETE